MSSWTGDVDDDEESEDEEDSQEEQTFEETFLEAVESDSISEIPELDLLEGIEEVDDEEALRKAWLDLDGERESIVENRIEELTGQSPSEENEADEDGAEEQESDSSGWGGSGSEESDESTDDPEPEINSGEEMEEEADTDDSDSDESVEETTGGPPEPSNAMTLEEASEKSRRWKIMVWGPPKLFKTHFAYTMPEPIAFLDLEGKADDLAQKFAGKEIRIWQPNEMEAEPDTKFRRAKKALDEAIEWLDWHRKENGEVGTIVVDSMTLVWEWAQTHHKLENYPLKDEDEVELSANFKSSQESDWAVIKEYHNGEFREKITDSNYHFYWTAMERESFEETFGDEENRRFMEPKGEPDNDYKVDTEIHARKDKDRGKVGDLIGSNYVDNMFVGLKKPTYPKVRDAIQRIEEAEVAEDPVSRSKLADEIEAEAIIDYDPQVFIQQ